MKYQKTGRYIYRNIAGEGVLVPVRDGICNLENMLLLNETSAYIWEKIEQTGVVDAATAASWLFDLFEVEQVQALKDASEILSQLEEEKCLSSQA